MRRGRTRRHEHQGWQQGEAGWRIGVFRGKGVLSFEVVWRVVKDSAEGGVRQYRGS